MDTETIIGLCIACPSLIALVVCLIYVLVYSAQSEKKYKETLTRMHKTITKYLEYLMKEDDK